MDDVIFEVPIFLRSPKEYENERLLDENKLKDSWGGEYDAMGKKIEVRWPPWEYNDIIGYFKIIINSSPNAGGSINGIRVKKYLANAVRIVRNPNQRRTKIWLNDPWFHKKLYIQNIQGCDTKSTLLKIIDSLDRNLSKTKNKTKRYFIDTKYYKNLIECLDLKKFKMN